MKTPKSSTSSKKVSKKTPKPTQPKPLKIVHPTLLIDAPPSSSTEPKTDTPSASTIHEGTKHHNTTPKGGSSSKPTKRTKQVDPNNAEEISKEMSVGFGLDKYWYDSTPFPQLHAILHNQSWETLMSNFCCNSIYPNLMREFISNFSIDNEVCSSVVKKIKI